MEAYKWFKNGDHPEDDCDTFQDEDGVSFKGEGKVARYFRRPGIPGATLCQRCDFFIHMHGWIDKPNGGQKVCPGDIIIKNERGEWEVFRKDWEYDNRCNEGAVPCTESVNPETNSEDTQNGKKWENEEAE